MEGYWDITPHDDSNSKLNWEADVSILSSKEAEQTNAEGCEPSKHLGLYWCAGDQAA